MKLSIISEVFQRPSLDDVDVKIDKYWDSEHISSAIYTFSDFAGDSEVKYKVEINSSTYKSLAERILDQVTGEVSDDLMSDLTYELANAGGLPVYVTFQANNSYEKTGFSNEFYVYSKVIACLHDFVWRTKPIALKFSGYSTDMDRVYDRFIKMANKMWPEYRYIPINTDTYVSESAFAVLKSTVPNFDSYYEYNISKRDTKLKTALDIKQSHRERKMRDDRENNLVNRIIGRTITTSMGYQYVVSSISNSIVVLTPSNDKAIEKSNLYGQPYTTRSFLARLADEGNPLDAVIDGMILFS